MSSEDQVPQRVMDLNTEQPQLDGEPVQIVSINEEDHSYVLNEPALERVLNGPKVKELPVCIVSVAGAFRRGKSFLLDFLLRYLNNTSGSVVKEDDVKNWLGSEEAPLKGFHWRGGSERDTTGILMWSKAFAITTKNGEKVAVVLMDTQGAFDSSSTVRDCATIFALSAMMSSVLVYNLTSNIQEDDLQHLELFTEYGRLAIEDSGEAPFQKLQFLVRDWSYPYEAPWGAQGGDQIVKKRLEVNERQHSELQDLRKNIHSCFTEISGFLLPHPGLRVATDPNFDGRLKDIESAFRDHLSEFVPLLLAPENIVIKRISGNVVRCKEVLQFFRAYIEVFKGDEMPEPKSMLKATSEANNLAAVANAKDKYMTLMEEICGGERPYINDHVLEMEHLRAVDAAMEIFGKRRKMGGEEFSASFKEKLITDLEDAGVNFKSHNDSKNIFKAANTPITLAAIAMLLYVLSQIFTLVGVTPLAAVLNLLLTATFILLATWAYVRWTGNGSEIGSNIDSLSVTIWESVIQPAVTRLAEEGSQFAARQALQRMNSSNSGLNSPAMSKKRN